MKKVVMQGLKAGPADCTMPSVAAKAVAVKAVAMIFALLKASWWRCMVSLYEIFALL